MRRVKSRKKAPVRRNPRKARQQLIRNILIGVATFALVLALAGGWWVWKIRYFPHKIEEAQQAFVDTSKKMGFKLSRVVVEGRKETPLEAIASALSVQAGDALLDVELEEALKRLLKLGWVEDAVVERQLPSTLKVRIWERKPIALWQNKGKLFLIDAEGVVITDKNLQGYSSLPLVVGEDAPSSAHALLKMLVSEPKLFTKVAAAVRIGERRWNIRFKGGIEAKLPEEDPEGAWKYLAELDKKEKILDRAISSIDLRIEGKMMMKLTPEGEEKMTTPTKPALPGKET